MHLPAAVKETLSRRLSDAQKEFVKYYLYHSPFGSALTAVTLRLLYRDNLSKLALAFGSDKEGAHHYAKHYQWHFEPLRKKRLNILEIGIGGYESPKSGGSSLRMWKAYFSNSRIFGIDVYDKKYHEARRIKTFTGSQVEGGGSADLNASYTSMNFLKSLVDGLNYEEFMIDEYKPTFFDKHIISMHFYHNIVFVYKGLNADGSNMLGKRFL
jgi:hypothetical protein